MPWGPGRQLPADWATRRAAVFERDGHRCTHVEESGRRCWRTQNLECDHLGDPDDHELASLATKCRGHHAQRTQAQAAEARKPPQGRRRPEAHPGRLR